MVGRITSKPGGKLEGYNIPMPKVRSSKVEVKGEENPLSSCTLEIPQLKQIQLLHAGESEEYSGPISMESIAEKIQNRPGPGEEYPPLRLPSSREKVNEKSESHRDI